MKKFFKILILSIIIAPFALLILNGIVVSGYKCLCYFFGEQGDYLYCLDTYTGEMSSYKTNKIFRPSLTEHLDEVRLVHRDNACINHYLSTPKFSSMQVFATQDKGEEPYLFNTDRRRYMKMHCITTEKKDDTCNVSEPKFSFTHAFSSHDEKAMSAAFKKEYAPYKEPCHRSDKKYQLLCVDDGKKRFVCDCSYDLLGWGRFDWLNANTFVIYENQDQQNCATFITISDTIRIDVKSYKILTISPNKKYAQISEGKKGYILNLKTNQKVPIYNQRGSFSNTSNFFYSPALFKTELYNLDSKTVLHINVRCYYDLENGKMVAFPYAKYYNAQTEEIVENLHSTPLDSSSKIKSYPYFFEDAHKSMGYSKYPYIENVQFINGDTLVLPHSRYEGNKSYIYNFQTREISKLPFRSTITGVQPLTDGRYMLFFLW